VNVHLHCIVSNVPSECANMQDHHYCCAVKSHSRVLATLQSNGKARKQEAILMKCYFVRILISSYIYYIIHKGCNSLKTPLTQPKMGMLTKTNICSVHNYLGGNTDRQQFENDKQNVDVLPWKNFCRHL